MTVLVHVEQGLAIVRYSAGVQEAGQLAATEATPWVVRHLERIEMRHFARHMLHAEAVHVVLGHVEAVQIRDRVERLIRDPVDVIAREIQVSQIRQAFQRLVRYRGQVIAVQRQMFQVVQIDEGAMLDRLDIGIA